MTKKILIAVAVLVMALGAWKSSQYFGHKSEEREALRAEALKRQAEVGAQEEAVSKSIWSRMAQIRTLEEWEKMLSSEVPALAEEEQKSVGAMVRSKIFEQRFWQAEHLLSRARALLEQDQNHPLAKEYLEEARKIYQKLEELLSNLSEIPGDASWNAKLYYYKGVYYFRSLLFLKIQEDRSKAQDLIAQSVENLSKALEYLPKDRDIQVAIEVLQKKGQQALAAGGENIKLQIQLLPSRGKEINPFAIGGREEGKQ